MTAEYKKTVIVFSLFVLVGVAVAFGLAIFNGALARGKKNSVTYSLIKPEEFSVDEKALLKTPGKDATETEKAAHFAVVNRLAHATEFLDLSACYGSPLAFRVGEGATFTVKNNDTVAHTLQISPEYIYTVPAKKEKKLTAQFGKGPGVYGYGCDDSSDARGILFVTH